MPENNNKHFEHLILYYEIQMQVPIFCFHINTLRDTKVYADREKNPENLHVFIAIKFQGIMYYSLGQIKMTHYFSSTCIINNILTLYQKRITSKLPANKHSYARIFT